jgi:hypothetical protein
MWPGATAWMMPTHQLTLALHHASVVLQHKSLVHHPLEILKVSSIQSIGQSIIQAIQLSHRFLRPKLDAHRMYAQDQVVIHMVRM